ncbi:DinB family protein [Arthrobacter sp. PsM3]|uniref:DinB family protein n=1 Tax=Arthrobacter sp. PsM3 TaxID=3030531 RepID=UPI00263B0AB8|nr:DinB family protein [Arthrobacter sp. PsM3]MDN4644489.1 DinB family protein [Arthrobacter sp. PsM3]
MPIIPDIKDWTWVLQRPCPECGFDASAATPATAAGMVESMLPRWRVALRRPDATERADSNTWSVLEYACHVRDVFTLFDHRLGLMLSEDDARFADWDQDLTAVEKDYANADPAEVSAELTAEGGQIAAAFARVTEEQWSRKGTRSNGSEFTVLTFAQYFLHDIVHHLHDVDG